MNVIDFLDRGVELYGDRVLVRSDGREIKYCEFHKLTCRIANAIVANGVGKTGAVATAGPNDPLCFAAQFGVIRSGRVWVPVNTRNGVEENIEILNRLGVEWVFYHSSFRS